jgi:hypothetical protein
MMVEGEKVDDDWKAELADCKQGRATSSGCTLKLSGWKKGEGLGFTGNVTAEACEISIVICLSSDDSTKSI